MTRTRATMADGQELISFNETPDEDRVLTNRPRDLPPVIPGSQIRFDALFGEWVGAARAPTDHYPPPR